MIKGMLFNSTLNFAGKSTSEHQMSAYVDVAVSSLDRKEDPLVECRVWDWTWLTFFYVCWKKSTCVHWRGNDIRLMLALNMSVEEDIWESW